MAEDFRDIEFDDDGDIVMDDTGDLKLSSPERTVVQDMQFRVATDHFDYPPVPLIGANLGKFRGQPSSARLADAIKEAAFNSLIKDGRFQRANISVDLFPLVTDRGFGKDVLALYVFLQDYVAGKLESAFNNQSPMSVSFVVNLETGLVSRITGVEE